jgi:hypothetical protein
VYKVRIGRWMKLLLNVCGDMVGKVVGLYDDPGLEYRGVNKSVRQEAPFAFALAWRWLRRRKLPPCFATMTGMVGH